MERGATSIYSFFFNDTATTEIYTLSLHDALPICEITLDEYDNTFELEVDSVNEEEIIMNELKNPKLNNWEAISRYEYLTEEDRKSTRLNPVTPISRMPSSA